MLLRLRSVAAVIPTGLLSLHPQVDQLLKLSGQRVESDHNSRGGRIQERISTLYYLQGQHHQGHANHDDHQQLGGPYAGRYVSEAHCGEGDDAEVEGVEEGEVFPRTLQVLDSTCAVKKSSD